MSHSSGGRSSKNQLRVSSWLGSSSGVLTWQGERWSILPGHLPGQPGWRDAKVAWELSWYFKPDYPSCSAVSLRTASWARSFLHTGLQGINTRQKGVYHPPDATKSLSTVQDPFPESTGNTWARPGWGRESLALGLVPLACLCDLEPMGWPVPALGLSGL